MRLRRLALAVVLAASAPACVTNPPGDDPATGTTTLTAREREMREDTKRFNDTVLAGCGSGALVGFGVGVVVAKLTHTSVGRTAVVGAVAGCAAGGVDGYVTAKREQTGRDELRALRSTMTDVQTDNAYLRSFIERSNAVLTEGSERLDRLRAQRDTRQVSIAEAEALQAREAANIEQMQARLEQARTMRDNYRSAGAKFAASPPARRDLDRELERMDQQIRTLEGHVGNYTRALAVSKA